MARKNVRSTKPISVSATTKMSITEQEDTTETFTRTNLVTFKTIQHEPTGVVANDQTVRFPYRSSKGNQYIMVAYV